MLFVSFATPDYLPNATHLVESLERFGACYHVAAVPSLGDWVTNCGRKAEFMLSIGGPHSAMCWIDADARLKAEPELLYELEQSQVPVAYHRFEGQAASGTVFVSGEKGREFLREWARLCREDPTAWDQRKLDEACLASGVTARELPPEYCFIYDHSRRHWPDARPVIEHYQASRRLRRD